MTSNLRRRDFLAGSFAAATATQGVANASPTNAPEQELIELRVYKNTDPAKQASTLLFVETALRPALNRQGIDRIGIFDSVDESDASVYVVIPYSSMEQLVRQNDRLEADQAYREAAGSHLSKPMKDPTYTRIESRLLRAFSGMPKIVPPAKESGTRIVELRIYESHNEERARRKVEMFNEGEIELMQEVGLAPVLFGETLISSDVPNLTYMLSADSAKAHGEHWKAFLAHPEWDRMKNLERYKGTVSHIVSVTMAPTAGSQL